MYAATLAIEQRRQVFAFDLMAVGFMMTTRSITLRSSRTLPGHE